EAAPAADRPVHPANILLNLIAILLAPMFLGASGGDIAFARMAAIETVNAYRTRNRADLIAVAQIIAFGLAALGSLSLSMVDDISLSMTLRLRNNANALSRSADQNRRAIRKSRSETADIAQPPVDADYEAAVIAAVADSQKRVADSQKRVSDSQKQVATSQQQPADPQQQPADPQQQAAASQKQAAASQQQTGDSQNRVADTQPRLQDPDPAPIPASAPAEPPAIPAADMTDREKNALWAAAMAEVAQEYTASLPQLPAAERRAASLRAAALGSTASHLLSGLPVPIPRP
ncbi:MAG: hypothetical protein ABSC06_28820, partial [Rhodopila sp.]